jgi:hypothetical protein
MLFDHSNQRIRVKYREVREEIHYLVITKIKQRKIVLPLFYIIFRIYSRKYLSGGLFKYRYFQFEDKIYTKLPGTRFVLAIFVLFFTKGKHSPEYLQRSLIVHTPKYVEYLKENKLKETSIDRSMLRIMSLLPGVWARNQEDFGFPHFYHLSKSAELANVSISDFPTNFIVSNPSIQDFDLKKEEWQKIEISIIKNQPNLVMISGHKRSFDDLGKDLLYSLKKKYHFKVVLLMLDDWSIDYLKVVEKWDYVVDKVLIYESKCIISDSLKPERILIWPFPRLIQKVFSPVEEKFTLRKIKFIGSPYLNRVPWLYFFSIITQKYPNVNLEFNVPIKIGSHPNSIQNYLSSYASGDVSVHFLERTPNIYTFTSSIWDAFSGGSLVIAQIGHNHDPISDFFRPGIDYIPFRTVEELKAIIDRLFHCPELILEISNSGQSFMKENYNANDLYDYLARKLFS